MSYWWLEHSNFLCVFLQGSRQPRRSSISKRDIPWSSYWRWRRQRLVRRTKAGWLGPADYVISYTLLRRKVSRLSIVFRLHVFVIFFIADILKWYKTILYCLWNVSDHFFWNQKVGCSSILFKMTRTLFQTFACTFSFQIQSLKKSPY